MKIEYKKPGLICFIEDEANGLCQPGTSNTDSCMEGLANTGGGGCIGGSGATGAKCNGGNAASIQCQSGTDGPSK